MRFGRLLLPLASIPLLVACGQDPETTTGSTTGTSSTTGSSTGGTGGGGGSAGTPLKIMDWNVHNFFDDKDDPAVPNATAQTSGETVKSTAQYDAQRAAIATMIGTYDPDIIVFAEVENVGVLEDLNADLGDKYVDLQVPQGNDARGVHIAAMSKIAFTSVVSHKDDSFLLEGTAGPNYKFSRDAPEFHLTYAGRDIVLVGIHFRSKGPPDDADKRLAEAQHTRAIADGLTSANADLGLVILGDANDTPGSFPVNALVGADPDVYKDAPDSVPSPQRWTYDYQGTLELIDHQLSNKVLAPMLDEASVQIPDGHMIDDQEVTDHSPIFAKYDIQ